MRGFVPILTNRPKNERTMSLPSGADRVLLLLKRTN
jgi:hypothetical protein